MAGLGSTSDPRTLVPGNPAVVRGLAAAFTSRSERAEAAADGLGAVRIPSWSGDAADAFDEVMSAQPRSWRITADALTAAAGSLSGYADVLTAAQSDAATAIDLWAQAEAATAAASRNHQRAVETYQRAIAAGRQAVTPDPYVDAGAPLRQQAQDLLETARSAVRTQGDVAAASIGRIEVTDRWLLDGGTSSEFLTSSGSTSGSLFTWDPVKGEGRWGLASASGEANAWEGRVWGEARKGGTTLSGEVEARVGADGTANIGVEDGTVKVGASGRLGVIVEGQGRVANEGGTTEINLDALGGLSSGLGANIGRDGVKGSAELFGGAKVGVDGSSEVAGIGIDSKVEAWRGYGFKYDFTYGRDDEGKFRFGWTGGYAQNAGMAGSVVFTVDPADLWRRVQEAVPFIAGTAG